ncbi:hypothetical protein C7N43_30820 [Sphingobacteriales bacterium UPWRP_1]|nr:hypothetical protein B6N25_09865 [Sphingobacteriales bacterium TSM_CSS]PSJ73119.1 hypothetical protein C7N43_30820 [Sphingobacteriales bacterium UPWRP_1]
MLSIPEELLESAQRQAHIYQDYLMKIAKAVITQNISKYPIFVMHREPELKLGRPVVVAHTENSEWSVNASLMEEFVNKGIISKKNTEDFINAYRNPYEYLCLFIISGQGDAGFAFCPYAD